MDKSTIFIPKKCKVGFNPREDTYTGRLGYVIYHDGKKWRKEPSWKGWIYNYISDEEYQEEKNKQYQNEIQRMLNRKADHDGKYQYYISGKGWKYLDKKIETIEEAERLRTYEDFKPNLRHLSNDENIKPFEFDNEPIEGFVLNKKAGGTNYGWNPRQTYCRVYDPRNFEIEITIPNLLYILENTNSIKGKGLEGKFVYGWDGKDLVLIPESAPEYAEMMAYTKLQDGKVYKRDMIPGNIYIDNKTRRVTYMGDAFELNYWSMLSSNKKKLWLCYTNESGSYTFRSASGVQSLKADTGEVDKDFANKMDALERDKYYYGNSIEYELISNPKSRLSQELNSNWHFKCYIKVNNKFKSINIDRRGYYYRDPSIYIVKIGKEKKQYDSINKILEEYELWQLKMTK